MIMGILHCDKMSTINLSKLDFKGSLLSKLFVGKLPINLSKLDFKADGSCGNYR